MTREDAVKGLRNVADWYYGKYEQTHEEDYLNDGDFLTAVANMLKEQVPRVMTLGEVLENAGEIGFPCWVEDHIEDIGGAFLFPAVVTSDDTYVEYIGNTCYEGAIYHWAYNKRLRCWTSCPDEKRRADTPWE